MGPRPWSLLVVSLPLCALAQSLPATAFLQRLPAVPVGQTCIDNDEPRVAFEARLRETTEALGAEIARRERVLKEVRSRNLKTMQQAQLGTPGVGGVDGEAMKKMSRAEKQQMAQQMMQQQYGVSPEEIAKLKAMKKGGNTAGVAGWGQAFTAEQQAAAAANPAAAAQAQGNAMKTAQLAARQSELAQRIAADQGRHEEQLRELAADPAGLAMLVALDGRRKSAQAVARCEARVEALKAVYAEETRYCQWMAPRHDAILESLRKAFVAHEGDYVELDRNEAQIQWLQFGIQSATARGDAAAPKVEPEQDGLSALKAVASYANRLADAYHYSLHRGRPDFAATCAGAR